jgi:hypothetical protein
MSLLTDFFNHEGHEVHKVKSSIRAGIFSMDFLSEFLRVHFGCAQYKLCAPAPLLFGGVRGQNSFYGAVILGKKTPRKCKESLDIVEIRNRAHGNAHGAGGFAVDAVTEIVYSETLFVTGLGETDVQFDAGDA